MIVRQTLWKQRLKYITKYQQTIVIWSLVTMLLNCTSIIAQVGTSSEWYKEVKELENGTYELKAFSNDSLPLFKGILSSVDPDIREGKYYFVDAKGRIKAVGQYNDDFPVGVWTYYDTLMQVSHIADYNPVWKYFNSGESILVLDSVSQDRLRPNQKTEMSEKGTFDYVDQMPTFHDVELEGSFDKYLINSLIHPAYSDALDFQGYVEIAFVLDSKGKIRAPEVISSTPSDVNLEAMRILLESSGWEPGYMRKVPVNVNLICRVQFVDPDKADRFYIVEEMPRFMGMEPAYGFRKFIATNLRYPEQAAESGASGRVIIQFTVMPDGSVQEIVIVRSVHPLLDQEAIRVVESSPKWTPGKLRGKNVAVMFTYPINFVL